MPYRPSPIDTAGITLPAGLDLLTERLAEHAHDVWAKERMAQGWVYGPRRDDTARPIRRSSPTARCRSPRRTSTAGWRSGH